MADILDLQDAETEPTPGEEKASSVSFKNFFCRNSSISLSVCMVK